MGRCRAGDRPRLLLLLVLAGLSEGTLKLRTSKGPVEVLLNENGLLHCEIDKLYGLTLSSNNLGISWVFIQGTGKNNIFTYSNGEITSVWKEAELSENSILNGDMSLMLKNVTFKHSGKYQCEVVIPPNERDSLTVNLEVLAQPTVTVVSEKIVEVGTGGEMTLRCQLTGYYPCESNVEWIQLTPSQIETKLVTNLCISPPIKNPDRTCNAIVEVSLEPRVKDIGSSYECHVMHKTLPEPNIVNAEVILKEAEILISTQSIIGSIIGSIFITVLLTATGILIYICYFYKVPPKVSDIQLPDRIVHHEVADIICHVAGFRPGDIDLSWYLQRNGKDEQLIHKDKKAFLGSMLCKQNEPSEMSTNENHWKVLRSFQTYENLTHSFSSTLKVFPDVMTDNNARIICRVTHPAGSEERCSFLAVHGIAPKLAKIIRPPVILHNRSLMLIYPIKLFKPNLLNIKWYKIINGVKSLLVEYKTGSKLDFTVDQYSHCVDEFSSDNDTYSVNSMLIFIATIKEDDGKEYLCEVNHDAMENSVEEKVKLEVKASPSLDTILCEPVNPKIEKELILSCKVHSFYPKSITVQWFKDEEPIKDFTISDIVQNHKDNLFELTTTCTIIPTLSDLQSKYQCRVTHKSLRSPSFVEYVLENLASSPKINEITCDPVQPEIGKELTLTCEIKEFYPEDIQIHWFRDCVRIDENQNLGIISETLSIEHGLYHKITKLTWIPSTDDQQAEYKVEVCHSKSSANLLKQSFQLFLKVTAEDFERELILVYKDISKNEEFRRRIQLPLRAVTPKVSEIKSNPVQPEIDGNATLSCRISEFAPMDINVIWSKGCKIYKVEEIIVEVPKIDETGLYSTMTRLPIIINEDSEEYTCEIEHEKTNDIVEKKFTLKI
ncbi:uncharacterized protein [Narcine bancroftii]|uniref:uncharacterized protein isoform X2 n=1 Tax=Narcine bancroftii TaxID=1343680 RepID=UPI003831448B